MIGHQQRGPTIQTDTTYHVDLYPTVVGNKAKANDAKNYEPNIDLSTRCGKVCLFVMVFVAVSCLIVGIILIILYAAGF